MNYYDKLLLESDIMLYDSIISSCDTVLESIELELEAMFERKKESAPVNPGDDENVGSRADQADHLEKSFDRLKSEVREVKKTKRSARARKIMNAIITLAAGAGAVKGLDNGSTEGQLLTMASVTLGVISNITTFFNKDVRNARHVKQDAVEWMDLKIDELDENIRANKGNIAVQKKLREKIVNEKSKIEKGMVGDAVVKVAKSAKDGISNIASKKEDKLTPATASESVEVDVIESYGLEFLTESEETSQEMNQAEIDKTKATINDLKEKKDGNGLMKLCRKLGNIAKKHPKTTALFVLAGTAAVAVSAGAFDDEIASIANSIATTKQTINDDVATAKQAADDLHTLATLAKSLEASQEANGGTSSSVISLVKMFM